MTREGAEEGVAQVFEVRDELHVRRWDKEVFTLGADARALLATPPDADMSILWEDRRSFVRVSRAEKGREVDWVAEGPQPGVWHGAASVDGKALDRLLIHLGSLTALRILEKFSGPRRASVTVELAREQVQGEASRVVIHVGGRTSAGCEIRLDGAPTVYEVPRAACDALLGGWTSGRPGTAR